MLRIGLSQRVDVVPSYGERRDGLDHQWALLIEEIGHTPIPFCNAVRNPVAYLNSLAPDAIVLTGGNDIGDVDGARSSAPERDNFERALILHASERRLPLFAVCRGFQMVNHVLGGRVSPVAGHVAKNHIIGDNPFGIAEVNSFHDFGIAAGDLAKNLVSQAAAPDGSIEAATHTNLPWTCVMWHPERSIPDRERHVALTRAALGGIVAEITRQ